MTDPLEAQIAFYEERYDVLGLWSISPKTKIVLGDKASRRCRFCGNGKPNVTFRMDAHAIPEALGNKGLLSAYECDNCNGHFGRGIETDLGNWSKPMRTIARIRGKQGVPTIKKDSQPQSWRIEYDGARLNIKSYESDPVFKIDETAKTVTFFLKRDAYTPVAVAKAFVKMGLTLLPDGEVANFADAMAWIRENDHTVPFAAKLPVIYGFQPGPMPNDIFHAGVLRRKPSVSDVPYAYFVLGYGNESFQVQLPSERHDRSLNGKPFEILPFPMPGSPNPSVYGNRRFAQLDWSGCEVVRNEEFPISMGFQSVSSTVPR